MDLWELRKEAFYRDGSEKGEKEVGNERRKG